MFGWMYEEGLKGVATFPIMFWWIPKQFSVAARSKKSSERCRSHLSRAMTVDHYPNNNWDGSIQIYHFYQTKNLWRLEMTPPLNQGWPPHSILTSNQTHPKLLDQTIEYLVFQTLVEKRSKPMVAFNYHMHFSYQALVLFLVAIS